MGGFSSCCQWTFIFLTFTANIIIKNKVECSILVCYYYIRNIGMLKYQQGENSSQNTRDENFMISLFVGQRVFLSNVLILWALNIIFKKPAAIFHFHKTNVFCLILNAVPWRRVLDCLEHGLIKYIDTKCKMSPFKKNYLQRDFATGVY